LPENRDKLPKKQQKNIKPPQNLKILGNFRSKVGKIAPSIYDNSGKLEQASNFFWENV